MTEKRFTLKHLSSNIYDNGVFIASIEIGEELIVYLLNSLNDESEQLKQKIISLEDARYSYKQDWKQASADCELYKDEIDFLKDENKELIKENEQLKQILNELSNMLQFDVENGIRSYPVKLSEYLSNVLKELQE